MRPSKNTDSNYLSYIWESNFLLSLIFSVGFLFTSKAQLYVSDSTVFIVAENTTLYVKGKKEGITSITETKRESANKIETSRKKTKRSNKSTLPLIVKKSAEPKNESDTFSFSSNPKKPSPLFYNGKTTKAAIVNTLDSRIKVYSLKNSYNNLIYLHLSTNNDKLQKYKTAISNVLLITKIHLEEQITRPPPTLYKDFVAQQKNYFTYFLWRIS